jgi:predicted nucleic acid-binding Zn ribbon protein
MGAVGMAPRTTLGPRLGLPDGEATAPGVFHPPQARRFHCLAAPLRLHDPALLYPRLWVVPIAPPQRVLSKPLGFMCVHVLHPTTLLTPPFRHCPFCGLVFKRALTVGLALFMASRPAFLQHLQRSIASGAPSAFHRRAGNQHPSRSIASSVPPTSTRRVPSRVGCPNQHLYSRSIAVCPNPHPSRSIASGVPSTSTCTRVPSRCALTRTRRVPSRAVCPQPALVAFHRERCALNQHCPFRGLVQRALTLPSDMLHALSAGHSLQGVLLVPFRHCPFCRLPLLRSTFSSSKNEPCFAFC